MKKINQKLLTVILLISMTSFAAEHIIILFGQMPIKNCEGVTDIERRWPDGSWYKSSLTNVEFKSAKEHYYKKGPTDIERRWPDGSWYKSSATSVEFKSAKGDYYNKSAMNKNYSGFTLKQIKQIIKNCKKQLDFSQLGNSIFDMCEGDISSSSSITNNKPLIFTSTNTVPVKIISEVKKTKEESAERIKKMKRDLNDSKNPLKRLVSAVYDSNLKLKDWRLDETLPKMFDDNKNVKKIELFDINIMQWPEDKLKDDVHKCVGVAYWWSNAIVNEATSAMMFSPNITRIVGDIFNDVQGVSYKEYIDTLKNKKSEYNNDDKDPVTVRAKNIVFLDSLDLKRNDTEDLKELWLHQQNFFAYKNYTFVMVIGSNKKSDDDIHQILIKKYNGKVEIVTTGKLNDNFKKFIENCFAPDSKELKKILFECTIDEAVTLKHISEEKIKSIEEKPSKKNDQNKLVFLVALLGHLKGIVGSYFMFIVNMIKKLFGKS